MIKYHNINGVITPIETSFIHISDLALHRGYGIFDYFLVKQGQPVFIDDYLDRFEASAQKVYLEIPLTRAQLKTQIHELIIANKAPNSAIKLLLTGGYSSDGYTPEKPNLIILGLNAPTYSEDLMKNGFHLMTLEHVRDIPDVKTINYVASLLVQKEMRAMKAHDVLYHKNGLISESSRSNFFLVKQDNTIVTATKDILYGVTRKHLLELANAHYKVEVRDVFLDEVFSAKEAFVSSSTKGAFAVTKINAHLVNNKKIGNVTSHLNKLFQNRVNKYIVSSKKTL